MIFETSKSFTRPADTTAYTSGDLVANSTTAGSVVPLLFSIPNSRGCAIWKGKILKSGSTATNASFRLHLFKDSPTVTGGDNAALAHITANFQGFFDISLVGALGSDSNAGVGTFQSSTVATPLYIYTDFDQVLYGLLEARGAYTPASAEVFTVTLTGDSG